LVGSDKVSYERVESGNSSAGLPSKLEEHSSVGRLADFKHSSETHWRPFDQHLQVRS
jgi:hypothetical protein